MMEKLRLSLSRGHILYRYGIYLALSLVLLLSHLNFLFPFKTVSPDASYILMSLNEVSGIFDYFHKLFSFQALDFLPVRDITFYFDMYVYQALGINIAIFINCLLWGAACINIFKIIQREYPEFDHTTAILAVACLSVHPVFSQLINWSMARKHLLAIYFTTLATLQFMEWVREKRKPYFVLTYFISLLSVPISLLWPVWAVLFCRKWNQERLWKEKYVFVVLFVTMILIGFINISYYSSSMTFLNIYQPKSLGINIQAIVIHIAFLFHQILFPYKLSFSYTYSPQVFITFGLMSCFILWLVIKKRSETRVWLWLFFGGMHSVLFLKTPEFYNDIYAAMPVIGLFFIFISLTPLKLQKLRLFLIPVIILWGFLTFQRNPVWGSNIRFFSDVFHESPTCINARSLAKSHYLEKLKLENELFEFLQVHHCFTPEGSESPSTKRSIHALESMQLYFEDDIDLEYRKKRLLELGQYQDYPLIMYSLLMTRENDFEEIERVMNHLNRMFDYSGSKLDYDPVYYDQLADYCAKNNLSECQSFIARIKPKKEMPFY